MSYTIASQPQLVPLTKSSLSGFISLSNRTEFYISVDYSTLPPTVDLDHNLQSELKRFPNKLNSIISSSPDITSFVESLVGFLETVLVQGNSYNSLVTLIKQISNLPPQAIKSVDKDFRQVTLQHTDPGEREHFLSVQLEGKVPTLVCDLPGELVLPSPEEWSCQELLAQFQQVIGQYQALWDVLDQVDERCWVVEPPPFTRRALHRRIVLREDVSVIVTLDPSQPTCLPRCRFLGSARAIAPLQERLDERSEEWDPSSGLVDNLTTVLGLELPSRPAEGDKQDMSLECGVCYCYDMLGQIPEISCNGESCRQLFHVDCLVEWFRGLPDVRQSFGTVFGECPYCSKPMHIQAVL